MASKRSRDTKSKKASPERCTTAMLVPSKLRSYVHTWGKYLESGVVSENNRKFITNFQMATVARVVVEPGDSSDDSDDFQYDQSSRPAGSLDLIHNTLLGIAARCEDDGARAPVLSFQTHASG